jgi:hypothetical protein
MDVYEGVSKQAGELGKIPFPIVEMAFLYPQLSDELDEGAQFEWQGRAVYQLPFINLYSRASASSAMHWSFYGYRETNLEYSEDWFSMCFPPDRLVQYRQQHSHLLTFVPLWTRYPQTVEKLFFNGMRCYFPDEWSDILGVSLLHMKSNGITGYMRIWNRNHPLCIVSDPEIQEWAEQTFYDSYLPMINPRPHHDTLLNSREHARAWLAQAVRYNDAEFWVALFEWNPQFLPSIWQLVFGDDTEKKCIFIDAYHENYSYTEFDAHGMKTRKSLFILDDLLSTVGPEWKINQVPGSAPK